MTQYHRVIHRGSAGLPTILMLHGYGDHSGRYEAAVQTFTNEGFTVVQQDFRGHGKSSGKRAYIDSIEEYLKDIDAVTDQITTSHTWVYAHSMGCLVLAKWHIDRPNHSVQRILLSSGLFKINDQVAPLLRKIAPLVSFLLPKIGTTAIDTSTLSSLPSEVKRYEEDPLNFHGKVPARVGYEFMKSMVYVQAHIDRVQIPAWVLHGSDDMLNDPEGSKLIYERLGSKEKQLHIINNGYHEMINDQCRDTYLALVKSWCKWQV